jgi:predicted DNA-binding protein
MSSTRTQIYLTEEQRRRLDERGQREGRAMASLIREAVDRYLETTPEADEALDGTFGSLPALEVPSRAEWDRG